MHSLKLFSPQRLIPPTRNLPRRLVRNARVGMTILAAF